MHKFVYHDNVAKPIAHMQMMGSASHTYGNALAFIQKWLVDVFPENLFKTFHVNSKIAHRQLRSTKHEYLKKEKPMMVLSPRIDLDDERFLQGTPIIENRSLTYNNFGMENLQPFFVDHKNHVAIKYQLNRTVMFVDVILIFSTLMQQLNYANYFMNSVPQNIPFTLQTFFESYLSQQTMEAVSKLSGVPLFDSNGCTKQFLNYMNSHSTCPVTYKMQGSTQTHEFYRYYPVSIDTLIQNISNDQGERVGQVMDSYQLTFTIRMEFYSTGFYYLYAEKDELESLPRFDVEEGSVLIPVYTDVLLKKDMQLDPGWVFYNRVTCSADKPYDVIDIKPLIDDHIWSAIKLHLDNGIPLIELIQIRIRKQGEEIFIKEDFDIDFEEMQIQLFNKDFGYYTYAIMICINAEYLNELTMSINDLK